MGWVILAGALGFGLPIAFNLIGNAMLRVILAGEELDDLPLSLGGTNCPSSPGAAETCGEAGHSDGLPTFSNIRARSFHLTEVNDA